MPAPLLLCDTPGLLYRGFFALPDSIKGAEGRPVNALVGSVNMTLWCIEKYEPRAVVMCFGQESADYRVEAYPDYHAARPEMPDDLAWQWERAPALYEALGWTVLGHESLEADDLMGSFAALETESGGETLILTADRDMFQCAERDVTILLQKARQQGPDEVGPDQVREIYGIDPAQVPDFIALRGDPSDGLPGAKGIGAKTAADLLRRKGDLEHVILGAIRETPSVRKALIEQAEELRMFRDIATLRMVALERPPDRADGLRGRVRRRPRRSAWAGSPSASATRLSPAEQVVARCRPPSGRRRRRSAMSTASWSRCAARSAPAPVGGGQQREQLVGLPAHEHVGVAQAVAPSSGASPSAVPERHDDPHEREIAPVAHAFGDQAVEQQATDIGARQDEGPSHGPTLTWRRDLLRRELDGEHVTVGHQVVAALEPQRALVARAGVAAGLDERVPADDLGADEALLDVGVDLARGVPGGEPFAQVPASARACPRRR